MGTEAHEFLTNFKGQIWRVGEGSVDGLIDGLGDLVDDTRRIGDRSPWVAVRFRRNYILWLSHSSEAEGVVHG